MSTVRLEQLARGAVEIPLQPASYDIWDKKYRLKSKQGEPVDKDIDHSYQRIAKALADVEANPEKKAYWYERFLWALRRGAIPAGRITSNAGAQEHKPKTSTINCTVSGTIDDSMDNILDKVHEAGLTLKAGCGIGYEFSTLRPRGAYVSGAGAYTSGPLSFMGGGAIFFGLAPTKALLSDTNAELINVYEAIRDHPTKLRALLKRFGEKHSAEFYYDIRGRSPRLIITRAARTLYLNRTCWNGLYRVNKSGHFNVPIGTKTSVIEPNEDFFAHSAALKRARLRVCDFEETIDRAKAGDLIFADPPYTVKHNLNGFLKYNENIFSWDDQVRLRDSLLRAKRRGAAVVTTNADHATAPSQRTNDS